MTADLFPNKSTLRDLNTNIHLVEKLHWHPLLLLPQEEHTLLWEGVVVEENTLCCLFHSNDGEALLLLLLEEVRQLVRLTLLQWDPVLRRDGDCGELLVFHHRHGGDDETPHPQDLTGPTEATQVGSLVNQAGDHHQVLVCSGLILLIKLCHHRQN